MEPKCLLFAENYFLKCEVQGWTTKKQYQPIGANGTELGVVALVKLNVPVEGTDRTLQVPCYVLNSNRPLWNSELWNCGLVLGYSRMFV